MHSNKSTIIVYSHNTSTCTLPLAKLMDQHKKAFTQILYNSYLSNINRTIIILFSWIH